MTSLPPTQPSGRGLQVKLSALVVDDHKAFRQGLRSMLEREPNIDLVAEAGDGLEALSVAREFLPCVVCMDMRMPRLNGVEATQRLVAAQPGVKVIGMSAYADQNYVERMLRAGAAGYITKDEAAAELPRALRAVLDHQIYLSPIIAAGRANLGAAPQSRQSAPAPPLDARQRELLKYLAEHRTPQQIAQALHLQPLIVEAHCRNLMRRLNLRNVADLCAYASQLDIESD